MKFKTEFAIYFFLDDPIYLIEDSPNTNIGYSNVGSIIDIGGSFGIYGIVIIGFGIDHLWTYIYPPVYDSIWLVVTTSSMVESTVPYENITPSGCHLENSLDVMLGDPPIITSIKDDSSVNVCSSIDKLSNKS